MELRLGKMTGKEIAEWMGISPKSYTNRRKEKLDYLKYFCNFDEIHGGVIIKEIYIPQYIKNIGDDDKLYIEMVLKNENRLCSIAGMTRALIADPANDYTQEDFKALQYRLTNAGKRTFGITKDPDSRGMYGSRKYVWAVKVNDHNTYRFRNEEENQIYSQLLTNFANSIPGKSFLEESTLYLSSDEATAQEYVDMGMALKSNFYDAVIEPFMNATGQLLVCATEHEVIMSQIKAVYSQLIKD